LITLRPHQQQAVDAMLAYDKGQVIIPTGGGKTICMIQDYLNHQYHSCRTTVVVAPRILLAKQLCKEFMEFVSATWTHVMHVHSGETDYFSTTKSDKIALFNNTARAAGESCIIFTTYHSLEKIVQSGICVDTIYFDEAHNSVQRNFYVPTEYYSRHARRCFYFTATPKHSLTVRKPGMNDSRVYGQVICNVPAPKLVEEGYILPPKVSITQLPQGDFKQSDSKNLLDTIDDNDAKKILIAARSTKQIVRLITQSDFTDEIEQRGYNWMYITSKTGAIINGKKVTRDEFFKTLNAWGESDTRFVIIHHSILSEGINVKGLDAVMFMRNMDFIGISQSIGRVIRLGGSQKTFGLVCVPVADKVGISTARSVQAVVNTVFEQGQPAVSVIRR
jgi:superfamily II DNA or RNA helicase